MDIIWGILKILKSKLKGKGNRQILQDKLQAFNKKGIKLVILLT